MNNPRKTAVDILVKIYSDNSYSNLILNDVIINNDFSKEDKKLLSALVYGVLDRKITLDYVLNKFLKKPIKKLQVYTAFVLRVGLYQIMYMDKIPVSAAVNEAVKLINGSSEKYNSGLVNAVLRNITRADIKLPDDDSLFALTVKYSCPQFIVSEFLKDYGTDTTKQILNEFLKPSKTYLRVNTCKTDESSLLSLLKNDSISAETTSIKNSLVLNSSVSFSENELFNKGYFHVQDISSTLCAEFLDVKPFDKVLDICAAPGGKTFTMAQISEDKADITACDLYESRVNLIEKSAMRLNLSSINTLVNDATEFNDNFSDFDKILCDVPCSGFGVIRRKPEIKYKSVADFSDLEDIQIKILNNAKKYLKNNGILVYSTCTLRKNENEVQVQKFLDSNPEFNLVEQKTILPDDDFDGFFMAKLKKAGSNGKN